MKPKRVIGYFCLMLCSVFLGYAIGIVVKSLTASAQTSTKENSNINEKTIEQAFTINPQVKFTHIKDGDNIRNFNESFNGEDDWLKRLSFEIENISKKSIVHLQFHVNFPETKSTGNEMSYLITFGQIPGSKLPTKKSPLLLKDKEKLEISLNDYYDKIVKFVEQRQPIKTISKVQFEVGFIVFEDKIAWAAGEFSRQDPDNPNRWINIGPKLPE
jgi:hypothetical protein